MSGPGRYRRILVTRGVERQGLELLAEGFGAVSELLTFDHLRQPAVIIEAAPSSFARFRSA